MAKLIKTMSGGGHWYAADGTPRHKMEGGSGELRNTTLRDAKKLKLIPSVTGIIGLLDKPALSDWKMKEICQATHAARHEIPDEDLVSDQMFRTIKDQAFSQVSSAAELGSRIHAAIEDYVLHDTQPIDDLLPYVEPVIGFLHEANIRPTGVEKILVSNQYGYAGTCDLLFTWGASNDRLGVLDWKTRRTREKQQIRAYDGQDMQLAAYCVAAYGEDCLDDVMAANVVVSTTEQGRMTVLRHEELRSSWGAFKSLCEVWRHNKSYDPRGGDDG